VFCCFNQSHKIDPTIFVVRMRLLKQVVLWLTNNEPTAKQKLRREAFRRGVAPERLIFAPRVPLVADHLARHRQADLFLDTIYYNARTTACDALWAGLPLVTCLGATFAGHVGASLLNALGVTNLITASLEDYEASALKFARDLSLLASIKAKMPQATIPARSLVRSVLPGISKPPTPRCGSDIKDEKHQNTSRSAALLNLGNERAYPPRRRSDSIRSFGLFSTSAR
jgi:protein O-GlcNAc transferase